MSEKILCRAKAVRSNTPCRRTAVIDTDGDGRADACELSSHQEAVRLLGPRHVPAAAAAPSPSSSSSAAAIGEAPAVEEITRPRGDAQDAVAALERLDRLAANLANDGKPIPEKPADAAAAAESAARGQASAPSVGDGGPWTPDQVAEWLGWIFNPVRNAFGKKDLSAAQLAAGGRAWAPPLNVILGKVNPNSLWGAAIAWTTINVAVPIAPGVMKKISTRMSAGELRDVRIERHDQDAPEPEDTTPINRGPVPLSDRLRGNGGNGRAH